MRLISYILTLLVLVLSCIPCSDKATTRVAVIQYTAPEGAQHASIDACSPFCICACCATNPVLSEHIVYSLYRPDLSVTHPVFCCSFVQELPFAVWQPPQLA
ncbi:DUF6660 family protein [Chitinophaga sp. RAB17]|uniref:DUF6660 family protein n=1 Tax=Chitinophaga sp. RAB17 TaxID=3233049 RepID=UPI003F8E4DF5